MNKKLATFMLGVCIGSWATVALVYFNTQTSKKSDTPIYLFQEECILEHKGSCDEVTVTTYQPTNL